MKLTRNVLSSILALVTALAACGGGGANPSDMPDAGPGSGPDGGSGSDAGEGPPPPFTAGVSTLTGAAHAGAVDGPRGVARFSNPVNVAYMPGTLYVADFDDGLIRAVDLVSLETRTIVSQQGFQRPFALAFAADGTLYATTDNDPSGGHSAMSGTVWRIDVAAKSAAPVATAIGRPRGLAGLPDGRLALSDYQHQVIETLDPADGTLAILSGTWDMPGSDDGDAATARFSEPYGLAARSDGTLAVADYGNDRIRLVATDGTASTLVSSGLSHPQGLAQAADGTLYLTDLGTARILRFAAGQLSPVAGDGTAGYRDDDDPLAAELYGLEGLSVVPDGTRLYAADGDHGDGLLYNRVRQVELK